MATVKTWAKRVNGAWQYAESYIMHDGSVIINPTDDERRAAGELPMAGNESEPLDGMVARWSGYEARDGMVYNVYSYDPAPPPPPRTFSKLKLYGAIAQLGAWDTVKAWLEGKTINGLNGWTAFQLAQDISEDHPMFAELASEARGLLGIDDVSFDALLDGCRLEA